MDFWRTVGEAFRRIKDRVAVGGQTARDSWASLLETLSDLLEKGNPYDALEERSKRVIDHAEERFSTSSRELIDEKWPVMVGEVERMLSGQRSAAESQAKALVEETAVRLDGILTKHRESAERQATRLMHRAAWLGLGVGVILIGVAYFMFRVL